MHDGRFATLEAVVQFYSLLPGFPGIGHREETLNRLLLSDDELAELVAFLKSLSSL
jgi:cytochrome c peroxidase